MHTVVDWTTAALPEDRPRHLLGIGEIDDLVRGVEFGHRHLRLRDADAARAATGWCSSPTPSAAGASTSAKARWKDSDEPLMEGCPCPACALGLTRGYLRYLAHARS